MQHGAHKLHVQYYSLLQRFLFHSSLTQRQQRAVMLANAHTKDVCFCKPPPGGLIYMRDPDNSGWLEVRPNRRPICNRHAFQMAFAVVCGPFKGPFRHSASEIPFRASLSPLKPNQTLASHDDFLRAQVVPSILPVIAISTLATASTRPCKPHLNSTT